MTQRVPLSDAVRAKFGRALFWTFATLNEDGWPNLKPVWVELRGPRVTLGLIEPDNAHERIEIRGEVVEIIEGPVADEHLDDVAESYLGIRPYPWRRRGERRVVLVIEPREVIHRRDDDDRGTLLVA